MTGKLDLGNHKVRSTVSPPAEAKLRSHTVAPKPKKHTTARRGGRARQYKGERVEACEINACRAQTPAQRHMRTTLKTHGLLSISVTSGPTVHGDRRTRRKLRKRHRNRSAIYCCTNAHWIPRTESFIGAGGKANNAETTRTAPRKAPANAPWHLYGIFMAAPSQACSTSLNTCPVFVPYK